MIKRDDWQPVDGFLLEKSARLAIKSDKNILVIAGPGTGKTEMLAQKANYLFETEICSEPYNIMAISFKKDSASNLLDRVSQRAPDISKHRFDSMTYDALAKRILDQFRNSLDAIQRPRNDYLVQDTKMLRAMVRSLEPSKRLPNFAANHFWESFSFLNKNSNGLSKRLGQLMLHGSSKYQATLSYHGIMQLAILIIELNPRVRRAFQSAYPYVFLDEFQDTTDLQYQFIRTLFLGSNVNITAVGDDKQRIMDFAGARKTIFSDFKNDFVADDLYLSMNHRSAPRIISLQKRMYDSLQSDEGKVNYAHKWSKDDGEISLIQAEDEFSEAKSIALNIKKLLHEGISPNEIGILVKQHDEVYAHPIIEELNKLGIKSRVESDYQSLIKEPLVKVVLQSIMFASIVGSTENWEEFYSLYAASRGITNIEDEQILYKADELLNHFLLDLDEQLRSNASVAVVVQNILDFWTKEFFQTTFPEYLRGSNMEEIIHTFTSLLEKQRESNGTWNQTINSFLGKDSIPVMTIHKSKGLEFKAVFLVALDDEAFWSFRKEPDATRRAFFVAISRAKKYLTFTFARNRSNTSHPGKKKHELISEFYSLIDPFLK